MKQKHWASALIFLPLPSEGDFQSQLQLFEDLSNKNYKGIAFAPLSSVNLVMPVRPRMEKRHLSG
ncbi:D-allose transporter subunit [Escherichia coli]|nr:D-allose transporter subunit [Escherichia coli]